MVQGKDKPTYAPYREDGDMCIIINAKDVCVSGRKLTDKFYRWHTGQVYVLFYYFLFHSLDVRGFGYWIDHQDLRMIVMITIIAPLTDCF